MAWDLGFGKVSNERLRIRSTNNDKQCCLLLAPFLQMDKTDPEPQDCVRCSTIDVGRDVHQ